MASNEIVLATLNPHKVEELQTLLASLSLILRPQVDWNVPAVEETGQTFVENALLKARHASKHTNLPAIADDSGLVVPSLNGEPGIRSARYAGDSADTAQNNSYLLRRIRQAGLSEHQKTANFYAVLVYLEHEYDPAPIIAKGEWKGRIIDSSRGKQGFGYDPLFEPEGMKQTAAELSPTLKNQLSHRGKAAKQFIKLFRERMSE